MMWYEETLHFYIKMIFIFTKIIQFITWIIILQHSIFFPRLRLFFLDKLDNNVVFFSCWTFHVSVLWHHSLSWSLCPVYLYTSNVCYVVIGIHSMLIKENSFLYMNAEGKY